MKTIEKLFILSFEIENDNTLNGILKTYLKRGVITNFDVLYVNKKYTELGLK